MKSAGLFAHQYGRFEFRAKFPQGKGYWPALWLMPSHVTPTAGWPACGEIDVVENQGDYPAVVQGDHSLRRRAWLMHLQSTRSLHLPPGQHRSRAISIPTFWNGRLIPSAGMWTTSYTKRKPTGPPPMPPYPAPFNQPFYIIMNLAVGGTL